MQNSTFFYDWSSQNILAEEELIVYSLSDFILGCDPPDGRIHRFTR